MLTVPPSHIPPVRRRRVGHVPGPGGRVARRRGRRPARPEDSRTSRPKAKSVIFLFMSGGVSHVDSFDPKPQLDRRPRQAGRRSTTRRRKQPARLREAVPQAAATGSSRRAARAAPRSATCSRTSREQIDDLAADPLDAHEPLEPLQRHARHAHRLVRRSPGRASASWVSYGLGTSNRNLPSFLVLAPQMPYAGTQVWASTSCPAATRGRAVVPGAGADARTSARACRRRAAGAANWTPWPDVQRGAPGDRAGRPAPGGPASSRSRRRSACRPRCPEAFDLSKETDDDARALRPEARADRRVRLAVPGRPPAGRARRAVRRADRHRLVEQLGLARRHGRPRPAGAATSISRSPGCSRT